MLAVCLMRSIEPGRRKRLHHSFGFTLIEMMIVMAIIVTLISLAIP